MITNEFFSPVLRVRIYVYIGAKILKNPVHCPLPHNIREYIQEVWDFLGNTSNSRVKCAVNRDGKTPLMMHMCHMGMKEPGTLVNCAPLSHPRVDMFLYLTRIYLVLHRNVPTVCKKSLKTSRMQSFTDAPTIYACALFFFFFIFFSSIDTYGWFHCWRLVICVEFDFEMCTSVRLPNCFRLFGSNNVSSGMVVVETLHLNYGASSSCAHLLVRGFAIKHIARLSELWNSKKKNGRFRR